MKINELDIFHYIEDYVDRGIDQVTYTRAQIKLKEWFKTDLTDEIFIELMKEIPATKSGRLLDEEFYTRFQEFLCNYYIDSPLVSEESYLILINNFRQSNNLIMNAPKVVNHKFFDNTTFGYIIDDGAISSVASVMWVDTFESQLFSSSNLVKFMQKSFNMKRREDYWSTIIIYQQTSQDILDFFTKEVDLKSNFDIVIDLVVAKYDLDFVTFMDAFFGTERAILNSKQKRRNIADAMCRQIRKNIDEITEDTWYWSSAIMNFIKTEKEDFWYVAVVIIILLEEKRDMGFVIKDLIQLDIASKVLGIIINEPGFYNISEINRVKIFELTKMEEFLPEEAKEIFIF